MKIQRSIGTFGLFFAAIGGIMGSGWLFGPFFAAKIAGPAAILAWVIGGLLMMVIALTYAELSSAFPMVGGSTRYLQLSHGTFVSYSMAWIFWLASAAVAPIETLALVHYISTYFPSLMYASQHVHLLTALGLVVAAVIMLAVCVVNVLGVKLLAKTSNIIGVFKVGIPVMTIIGLFIFGFHSHHMATQHFFATGFKSILIALPMAGVIFSFIGYSPAIQLAGEAKNPQRAIPIAILGSLITAIVVYVLLQIVFVGALSPSSYAQGWKHLSFHADAGPFVGMALGLHLKWLVVVIIIGALIAPLGTVLVYTAATARTVYAMGDNGYLPTFMLKLNRYGIPTRIILLNYIIGLFLFLPFPTWQKLVSFLVLALVMAYSVGPLALVVLRKTLPDQHRPFRLRLPRLTCITAFYICNLIVFWTGWHTVWKVMMAIAIGYVVLLLVKCSKQGRQLCLDWKHGWWILLYLAIVAVVSYLGSFGGGLGLIPFGWDFLVIAVYSVLIYELTQWLARPVVHQDEISEIA